MVIRFVFNSVSRSVKYWSRYGKSFSLYIWRFSMKVSFFQRCYKCRVLFLFFACLLSTIGFVISFWSKCLIHLYLNIQWTKRIAYKQSEKICAKFCTIYKKINSECIINMACFKVYPTWKYLNVKAWYKHLTYPASH